MESQKSYYNMTIKTFNILILFFILTNPKITLSTSNICQDAYNYIDQINSFSSSFKQVDSNKNLSFGHIYFSKPNKIRLDYYEPTHVTILVNNGLVNYYDRELEQSHNFFTTEFDFFDKKQHRICIANNKEILIKTEGKKKEIGLALDRNDFTLKKISIEDNENLINIEMTDMTMGVRLDKKIFSQYY